MDDLSEHQDDAPDKPKPSWQRVMQKKKRQFGRTVNPSKKAASDSSATAESSSAIINAGPTEPSISRAAARKPTKAELTRQLKRKHRELPEATKELATKDKQVATLTRKAASFAEATHKARTALRQQKSESKSSDASHKKMLQAVQDNAEATIMDAASYHEARRQKEEVSII
jgi:predicted transcriptional regulator